MALIPPGGKSRWICEFKASLVYVSKFWDSQGYISPYPKKGLEMGVILDLELFLLLN